MRFRVGQKVVCVDASGHYGNWTRVPGSTLDGLRRGAIYTVRRVGRCRGLPAIWTEEITRPKWGRIEPGYAVQRFRPVVERKTDISIFKKMLNPSHLPEEVG